MKMWLTFWFLESGICVLLVGLGGGGLPVFLHKHFPKVRPSNDLGPVPKQSQLNIINFNSSSSHLAPSSFPSRLILRVNQTQYILQDFSMFTSLGGFSI